MNMKKWFLLFCMSCATIQGVAQEHLQFDGIDLRGNLKEFCQNLEKKGYCFVKDSLDTRIYRGKFLDHESLVIPRMNQDSLVNEVIVEQYDLRMEIARMRFTKIWESFAKLDPFAEKRNQMYSYVLDSGFISLYEPVVKNGQSLIRMIYRDAE